MIFRAFRVLPWLLVLCALSFAQVQVNASSRLIEDGVGLRDDAALNPIIVEGPVDSSYVVGPGDMFELFLERSRITLQVSPDGTVGIEQVGVVEVGGLKLAEAKRRILAAMVKHYAASECFVKIAQLKKFRVGVYGAVFQSGQQVVESGTRLSMAVRQASGATHNANPDSTLLIRGKDTILVRMLDYDLKGNLTQDPVLQQGDMIIVPYFNTAGKLVYVRMAGVTRSIPWGPEMTIKDYLERVRLIKVDANHYTHVKLQKVEDGPCDYLDMAEAQGLKVNPGTVIEPAMQFAFVYVGGALGSIGRFEYNPTYTPQDYALEAGMIPITASLASLHVIRKDGKEDWVDPVKGTVNPGDYIDIPKSNYETFKDVSTFIATLLSVAFTGLMAYATYENSRK